MKKTTESSLQAEIYKYYNNTYCLMNHNPRNIIFSVPNGSNRGIAEAMMLKSTGLLAGVSDLILVHNGNVIFIEVKLPNNNQQPVQKDFETRIKSHNLNYFVVKSLNEFIIITDSFKCINPSPTIY